MPDVIRVKYIPYSYTVKTDNTDAANQVTFSVVQGRLAEGLQMYPATGEIYGVPLEAGEFKITVQADYSNPLYPSSRAKLTLIVLDNTDSNVGTATDAGYEITQPVPNLNVGGLSGSGSQTLVSKGEYAEFQDAVYLDGRRLVSGEEYTSEAGSTRITIQNQTLADAGTGSHTLSVEFRTQDTGALRRAAQNLVISGAGNSGNEGSNLGNSESCDDDGNKNADNAASSAVTVIDYIVQPGDTLWRIAAKYLGDGNRWRRIYEDNTDVLQNPNRLRVGQHIKLYLMHGNGTAGASATAPDALGVMPGGRYAVQQGDNLWKIAKKVYGQSWRWKEIYEANRNVLTDPARIYKGQVIVIP